MNFYSHLVVASKLEARVNPENSQEYYWGSVIPDIRYLAAMQRRQTHLPAERIIGFISEYPHLKSFLQGYLVHCLSDEIELKQIFSKHIPFSLLKNKMPRQPIAIILELYYLEKERGSKKLSGSYNEVLRDLGVSESQAAKFSDSIRRYLLSSPESRFSELSAIVGLKNYRRIQKYMDAANRFQKNELLKQALFFSIATGKISEQIVSVAESRYQQCNVCATTS